MQRFEQEGPQAYGQIAKKIKSLKTGLSFFTPKHDVTVLGKCAWKLIEPLLTKTLDVNAVQADCVILVLAADSLANIDFSKEIFSAAKQLVIVINKMWAIISRFFNTTYIN